MADRATDLFASAGGLDALAFAIEHQRSTSSAGTPPPANGPSAASASHELQQQQQQQQHNGAVAGTSHYGSSQIDGFEAASLLGALSGSHGQQHGASSSHPPPPPGAPFDPPHLASSSSSHALQPPGGPSTLPPGPSTAPPADGNVPIPPELLQWDDTLTTAERVKLGKRAVPAPSSSPTVKKEAAPPAGKAPARKKKPKTTVGAVAAAAAAAGSPKAKPPAGKGKGKAAGAASAKASAAAKGAASSSAPAASSSSSSAAATADPAAPPVKKDKGKFLGLGRAWRKGLNISGDRLKEMTREEIERELVAKGTWVPGMAAAAAGNAAASGSGSGTAAGGASASAAPAKKPSSTKTSGSTAAPTSGAGTSTKKKAASKSATPSAVAGPSSSAVPAKRKAPATAEGKSKKSSKSTAKKTVLSAAASLSLSHGRNSTSPGASRSRSATADRHGSVSVEPSVPPPDSKDDDDDEKDDSLYCLCQELYDEDRAMLACDICEQWFHPPCVGLPEDRIDLVGQFICPRCVEHTDERTTWKTKCQTEGCFKSAVPGLTKYCSTSCGETHLVRLLEDAGLPRRHFEVYTADAQPPSGACIPNGDFPGSPPFAAPAADEPRRQLLGRAADLRRSIAAVEGHLGLLGKRLALLSLATRRADLVQLDSNGALLINPAPGQEQQQQPVKPAQEEPYNPKKKKSKFDSGPAANRVCGFDERLVLDEAEWAAWVRSDEGTQTVGALDAAPEADDAPRDVVQYMQHEGDWWCGKSKKRCDAHSAWHKIRLDDFLLEQSAKQTQLAGLRDSLQATQKEVDLADRRASQKREVGGDASMDVDEAPAAADGAVEDEAMADGAVEDDVSVKAEPAEEAQDVVDDAPPASPRPNGDGAREDSPKSELAADHPAEGPSEGKEGEQEPKGPRSLAAAAVDEVVAQAGDGQSMQP